ncbi:metallopeptidase TldD-related protein [Pontiella agarivorans]|uniref:Metallopeptidase TldD-related protein n=1 Tax=Pontiella agarivorans TaxID=3038953 RepID=A0ABU5MXE3_9BACT|nr:metallopeptidase TldD-related protein [Pontiella agarivorans]MDZ8118885.1 metallopeptidase TldD-related protein [Pontiella agarivorans]
MNQTFINNVTAALNAAVEAGTLTGWSLNATESRSLQRLYSSPDAATLHSHQSRRVEGEDYKLSVYTPSETEGLVGTAMIDLVSYLPVAKQIDEAVKLAACSQNRTWDLAKPPAEEPQAVETCDPDIRDHPEKVASKIEEQFTAAFAETDGCALNSAELFVNYSISAQTNSEGLAYETELSELYLEAAMEKAGQENDKEVHEHTTSVTVNDLDVETFIRECALQVATLGDSAEPETQDGAIILIEKDALSQMLEALLGQLNVLNEYLKLPFLNLGDTFGGGNGDPLHLSLDPTIPCMVLSSAYAIDGLPARGGTLIENNTVKNRIIGNRFGQYLDLEPNGLSGNLVVKPGTLDASTLQGVECTQIIKFSSLLIDAQKLTWSSEIKLGKHIAADGTVTLVKGGVVSGNLKDNFTDCRLSSTIGTVNVPKSSYAPPLGYKGPDAMLITKGVSIAGK